MTMSLPRAARGEQFIDPSAVIEFIDAVECDASIELHSFMVVRRGHVAAEGWWYPHSPDRARLLYSLSKMFTATALGIAQDEGLLDLDDTLVSHFPEFDSEIADGWSKSIRLRDLAAMASGHDHEMLEEAVHLDPEEPVKGFLLSPPDHQPGTLFAYSQPCPYSIASVIQRRTGLTLTEYLRPRLFDPLGIGDVEWWDWPPGRELGFTGLFARTEDIAKLGQLFLMRGRWGDVELLSEAYIAEATSLQVMTPNETDGIDSQKGYGFQIWMSRHGYRGDGAFGQFCIVLPEHDTVIAATAGTGTGAKQGILNHVWERLLPGLETAGCDNDMRAQLEKRLSELRLPVCAALLPAVNPEQCEAGELFTTVRPNATTLTSVYLQDADNGLSVTIIEHANALTFFAKSTEWSISEPRDSQGNVIPVAAVSGWVDDRTARIEIIFLETPHRMDIVCSFRTRSAHATWRLVPLDGGKLETLHRPRKPGGVRPRGITAD